MAPGRVVVEETGFDGDEASSKWFAREGGLRGFARPVARLAVLFCSLIPATHFSPCLPNPLFFYASSGFQGSSGLKYKVLGKGKDVTSNHTASEREKVARKKLFSRKDFGQNCPASPSSLQTPANPWLCGGTTNSGCRASPLQDAKNPVSLELKTPIHPLQGGLQWRPPTRCLIRWPS
jgi:hypothetical protein